MVQPSISALVWKRLPVLTRKPLQVAYLSNARNTALHVVLALLPVQLGHTP